MTKMYQCIIHTMSCINSCVYFEDTVHLFSYSDVDFENFPGFCLLTRCVVNTILKKIPHTHYVIHSHKGMLYHVQCVW